MFLRRWPLSCRGKSFTSSSLTKQKNKFDSDYLGRNEANYTPLSPISQLKKTVSQYPNVICYWNNEVSKTWREVNERVKRLADSIEKLGIVKNDVVSIIAPNTPSIFEAHFAIPSTGAVLHCINTRADPIQIAFQLKHAETKILLVDTEFSSVIEKALALMDDTCQVTVVQITDDYISYPHLDSLISLKYEDLISSGNPSYSLKLPDDEWDTISLCYTSGTTGNPKGVVSHHRGAYLNSMANMVKKNRFTQCFIR
jgi:fatty-acyl-CoA synthase